MERKNSIIKNLTLIIFLILFSNVCSCSGKDSDIRVFSAHNLRMNGEVDSAKTLLEEIIEEDSTNAMAWYELARTKHHMGLGDPRKLLVGLEDILNTIEKAVELESDNVIYSFYKGLIKYTIAYVAIMRREPGAQEKVQEVIQAYQDVLKLKPDYPAAMLYLVEVLSAPADMGGDSLRAEEYTTKLDKLDYVFGAKARELLLPEDSNRVEFWKGILEDQPQNPDVLEALGKAYLYENNIEEAKKLFEMGMSIDTEKNILHVDIGRYYIMLAMQNKVKLDSVALLIENEFNTYLNSKPEPVNPIKAFVIGKLADIKFRTGDNYGGKKYQEEAKSLDPYYSKAFAVPSRVLFDPPDEVINVHNYFSRPF